MCLMRFLQVLLRSQRCVPHLSVITRTASCRTPSKTMVNIEERFGKINLMKEEMFSMYQSAVSSVMPGNLVSRVIQQRDEHNFEINGTSYFINNNVYVVGFGKAVLDMAIDVHKIMGNNIIQGIISVPEGTEKRSEADFLKKVNIQVRGGAAGNLPDTNAENTALAIADLVQSLQSCSILIVLISGGGSALLPAPVPGITVNDKAQLIFQLQSKGASIQEINSVRKKLSLLKGGKLAAMAFPASVISFILSDIIGDPLDLIASGPTVENPDPTTLPFEIVKKYDLVFEIKQNVLDALKNEDIRYHSNNCQKNVLNILVGNNKTALEAAKKIAVKNKYFPVTISDKINLSVSELSEWYCSLCYLFCNAQESGNYEDLKNFLSDAVKKLNFDSDIVCLIMQYIRKSMDSNVKGLCLIGGGEPTVTIPKNCTNKGGRSQELALRFSYLMNKKSGKKFKNFVCVLMAAGTDGIDGPTDAAGAYGYSDQIDLALEQKVNPLKFIEESNSYGYYSLFEDIIKVGHTGTNVMDFHVLMIQKMH